MSKTNKDMNTILSVFLRLTFIAFFMFVGIRSNAVDIEHADVNFIIVSDLGAFGGADQPQVAETLGEVASEYHPTAILNLGDMFHFWGVQSTDDPGWQSNFENIYTNPWLHSLWYCALGNHDYQGNTQALLDYTDKSRRWNMPARYYTRNFKSRGTEVEVIFLDSTPFLGRAHRNPDIYPDAAVQDTLAQKEFLARALADAKADWVIVAAHHPLYSSRPDSQGQRADILANFGPILAQNEPDLYISGDVHCFEHFAFPDSGTATDYVTCSSGSEAYPIANPDSRALFTSGKSGFMTISASKEKLHITMLDRNGNIIYEFDKTKN